tara:strand:+ start:2270 stop:3187 length:918 start_codon:yes stop_codon:yes gene_type:complete
MKILITGGLGHIGSYFIENINKVKNLKTIYIVDNLSGERTSDFFNKPKTNKNIYFYNIDLSKKNSLGNFKKVDVVLNLASITNAEASIKIKKRIYKNNLGIFKNVLKYCIKNSSNLIHVSSTSVYGKQSKIVDEDCEEKYLKPQSPYAKVKLIEEKLLKKNSKKLKYSTFRFGTIAGVSQGIRFHTAVNKFCFNAAMNEKIGVYKTALHQYRPYLSIKDSFKVFKFCIEKKFYKNDIFNALTGNFTVFQILKKIKKHKKNIKIKYVNSKIMNQLSYHVKKVKLEKSGIKLNSNLDLDIKNTLNLF